MSRVRIETPRLFLILLIASRVGVEGGDNGLAAWERLCELGRGVSIASRLFSCSLVGGDSAWVSSMLRCFIGPSHS